MPTIHDNPGYRKVWDDDLVARVWDMARIGLSMGQVAIILGVTRNQIAGVKHRHGITFNSDVTRDQSSEFGRQGALKRWRGQ